MFYVFYLQSNVFNIYAANIQRSKRGGGGHLGGDAPPPSQTGLGERRNSQRGLGGAPVTNDFRAFHEQFYAISSI